MPEKTKQTRTSARDTRFAAKKGCDCGRKRPTLRGNELVVSCEKCKTTMLTSFAILEGRSILTGAESPEETLAG